MTLPFQPTWKGIVIKDVDALILFEASLAGILKHAPRRPHDRERGDLIKSGNVFIYDEQLAGIKRWTDGIAWSPSRILSNFLVYRQLTRAFLPGEKKKASKKGPNSSGEGDELPEAEPSVPAAPVEPLEATPAENSSDPPKTQEEKQREDRMRELIGSLVDSYDFLEGGLVKRTMSILWQHHHHHLVSYYTIQDALDNKLRTVSDDERLKGVIPRDDLARQNFRIPVGSSSGVLYPQPMPHPAVAFAYYTGQMPPPPPGAVAPVNSNSTIPANSAMDVSRPASQQEYPYTHYGYPQHYAYYPPPGAQQGYVMPPQAQAPRADGSQETYAPFPHGHDMGPIYVGHYPYAAAYGALPPGAPAMMPPQGTTPSHDATADANHQSEQGAEDKTQEGNEAQPSAESEQSGTSQQAQTDQSQIQAQQSQSQDVTISSPQHQPQQPPIDYRYMSYYPPPMPMGHMAGVAFPIQYRAPDGSWPRPHEQHYAMPFMPQGMQQYPHQQSPAAVVTTPQQQQQSQQQTPSVTTSPTPNNTRRAQTAKMKSSPGGGS